MAVKQTISKERFKKWLSAKQELFGDAEVGLPKASASCPLANYLTETRGHQFASVSGTSVSFTRANGTKVTFSSPKWVEKFVAKVDNGNAPIKASQALALLEAA